MAEAWRRAGNTKTDDVISALESGITFDAPEGRVLLDPATHHLTMNIRMAKIDRKHNVNWVHDFGPIEPWWLRSAGVNLVRQNDAKQYLPWDDARYIKYKR
jgi:branched-chain amino acid transport system substrate-binding protein